MKRLWFKNLRDIIILPFTVACVVPVLIYDSRESFISGNVLLRFSGVSFFASGLLLFIYTVFLFNIIGKGTLAPWTPKVKLVIQGPYRYTRNPMITGVGLMLIGEALMFHSTSILIWSLIFFVINTVYLIFWEEPGLSKRFGEGYQQYKKHVPRWIPKVRPYKPEELNYQ